MAHVGHPQLLPVHDAVDISKKRPIIPASPLLHQNRQILRDIRGRDRPLTLKVP